MAAAEQYFVEFKQVAQQPRSLFTQVLFHFKVFCEIYCSAWSFLLRSDFLLSLGTPKRKGGLGLLCKGAALISCLPRVCVVAVGPVLGRSPPRALRMSRASEQATLLQDRKPQWSWASPSSSATLARASGAWPSRPMSHTKRSVGISKCAFGAGSSTLSMKCP